MKSNKTNWRAYFAAAMLVVLGAVTSNVALVTTGVVEMHKAATEEASE